MGSTPFNSIAVVHKWEILDENDLLAAAREKSKIIENQLRKHVSAVIPVSGPLSLATDNLSPQYWHLLSKYFSSMSKDDRLTRYVENGREERFKNYSPEGAFLLKKSGLPWACFKAIWNISKRNCYPGGQNLHELILKASGVRELKGLLKERFIERTRLIKSYTLLAKAIDPCKKAILRIKNDVKKKEEHIERLKRSHQLVKNAIEGGTEYLSPVCDHLEELRKPLELSIPRSVQREKDIDILYREVKDNYDDLNRDVIALSIIDENRSKIEDRETFELRTILGCYGYSLAERVACFSGNKKSALNDIDDRIAKYTKKMVINPGGLRKVYSQIVNRLQDIADIIDKTGSSK
jgi:hypothetical protein